MTIDKTNIYTKAIAKDFGTRHFSNLSTIGEIADIKMIATKTSMITSLIKNKIQSRAKKAVVKRIVL